MESLRGIRRLPERVCTALRTRRSPGKNQEAAGNREAADPLCAHLSDAPARNPQQAVSGRTRHFPQKPGGRGQGSGDGLMTVARLVEGSLSSAVCSLLPRGAGGGLA